MQILNENKKYLLEKNEPNIEIKPIVDPDRTVKMVERTSSEKTAAFLLLIDQLDDALPEPVLQTTSVDESNF